MFLPIGDDNPTERKAFVNYTLIVLNVVAFLALCLGPANDPNLIRWTMIPAHLDWTTLFTSLFLHAGWMHLIGNMLFLWIFGDNVEDRLGHVGYILFYFVCGLAADAAHILSNPTSEIPTLGASGAISGVMGAYILFYPRHHVKTFVWLGIWYADVIRTPAWLWIGFWFGQQILLNLLTPSGGGGVAYLAHIGGFAAGIAIAIAIRAAASAWRGGRNAPAATDHAASGARRPFLAVPEAGDVEWVDEPGDPYSVLRLDEDPSALPGIAEAVHAATGESPLEVTRRLAITRGMIARQIPREAAEAILLDLRTRGIPSAKILHNRANMPPVPVAVEGASWDARSVRFRTGDQIVQVPWAAPFLWVGARSEGHSFIDVYINRRAAFRVRDSRATLLTEVDASGRSEIAAGFTGFARAIRKYSSPDDANDGIVIAANQDAWGRLDFPRDADYHDYIFWLYNLILARSPRG